MKSVKSLGLILAFCLCLSGCFGDLGTATPSTDVTTTTTTTGSSTTEASTAEVAGTQTDRLPLPQDTLSFSFCSGAGAWGTELRLNKDGTFTGLFNDSDMGDMGEGYPNGTRYTCSFSGKFENIVQVDALTYKMTLEDIQTERASGDEWIDDGVRYIATGPYGLEGGKEFIFYLPDTPVNTLSQEFLSWWPYRYDQNTNPKTTLSCYGILNVATGHGYFHAI